jgi:hypothetical protein
MNLVSVPAVYDGKEVRLLETPPVHGPYRVLVTFVEPAGEGAVLPPDRTRFWASFAQWTDDRPVEETLQDIHDARQSKAEPPSL